MFQSLATCTPADQSLFFSELRSKVARAKAICDTCTVKSQCLAFALESGEEFGIFGGLTPEERAAL